MAMIVSRHLITHALTLNPESLGNNRIALVNYPMEMRDATAGKVVMHNHPDVPINIEETIWTHATEDGRPDRDQDQDQPSATLI